MKTGRNLVFYASINVNREADHLHKMLKQNEIVT